MKISTATVLYFSGTGTTEKTVRRIAAQAAQQLEAVHPWEHHVQHDEVIDPGEGVVQPRDASFETSTV